jgi:PKD domain/Right handed beta helix region
VTLTRSGTPSAPITFTTYGQGQASIYPANVGTAVLTLKGVHDVTISNLGVLYWGSEHGIDVTGSHGISLDRLYLGPQGAINASSAGVSVDGGSSNVTVSRTQILGGAGYGVRVLPGAQQVSVTTNVIYAAPGTGVAISGTAAADVTSNTIEAYCGSGVAVDGGSSAVVENNVVDALSTSCPAPAASLSVSADSAGTTVSDYNALFAPAPGTEYSWAGTAYTTAAAFHAATAQGGHDLDLGTLLWRWQVPEYSPVIDSADCNAPGELSTDIQGNPRVADPLVTDTGNGTCHTDRGALERQDPLGLTYSVTPGTLRGAVPYNASVTITSGATSPWNQPISYTVDFGDGGGPVQVAPGGTVTHTYTAAGLYQLVITAADPGGSSQSKTQQIEAATAAAPAVTLAAGPYVPVLQSGPAIWSDNAVFSISAGADTWELTSGTIAFGDGTSQALGTYLAYSHFYSQPGTYAVTVTETDVLGRTSTARASVTVGHEYVPFGPYQAYSSTVPAHARVALSMIGLQGPSGGGAYVNVTVRNPKTAGAVTMYPDGAPSQAEGVVQFRAGQSVSNMGLAEPGTQGLMDFYNNSNGPVSLTIDTVGWDDYTMRDTYSPDGPVPVLATTMVAAQGHLTFQVAGSHGVPAGANAAVLDITATRTSAAGYLTAYGDKTADPKVSDAAWARGQTVTCQVVVPLSDGKVVLHNASAGSTYVTAAVAGYYTYAGTGSVFLPSRARLLKVAIGAKNTVKLKISGKNGLPSSGISAATVNLTASGATASGFLVGYPDGTSRPAVTTISYSSGATVANWSTVPVGPDGSIDLYNGSSRTVTVVVDLIGAYYQYPSLSP